MCHGVSRKKAFSMVELLVVMGLIAMAFVPLLVSWVSGVRANRTVDLSVTAIQLAEQKLEVTRGGGFSAIASEPRAVVANYPDYEREMIVSNASATLKDVEVKVYWPVVGGEESCSLRTYMSQYEVNGP